MDKTNTVITSDVKNKVWALERDLQRAERSAKKHQSDAKHWRRLCRKAEEKLGTIAQEARNRGLFEGLGYGLILGASAVYAEALIWKRIFKK